MIYGSVCSGIESASVAWKPLGWQCAFMSEIEKFPRAVLAHRFPEVPLHGDFTTIQAGEYRAIDILVGGTPCQDFSVAGKRAGMDGARGGLTLEYLRLADRLRPQWLVWENVPGVLSSNGGRDFGALLGGLAELRYGFAWRVLDAQFIRVDAYARAVPQRRQRVFLVGYLGDWRPAAAAILEPEGMSGDPAPRREAGKGHSRTAGDRLAFGGGRQSGPSDVAACLAAHGQRLDWEVETFVAEPTCFHPTQDPISSVGFSHALGTGSKGGQASAAVAYPAVAHTLRAEGFDASEDGTGRGTPIVAQPIPFDTTQLTSKANRSNPQPGAACHPLCAGADAPAIAFAIQERAVSENPGAGPQGAGFSGEGCSYTLEARHHVQAVSYGYTVRRLSVTECHRLQGFPDEWCNIPWRGRNGAPDGPQYKALGNSKAVNAVRWIGQRIDMVQSVLEARQCA